MGPNYQGWVWLDLATEKSAAGRSFIKGFVEGVPEKGKLLLLDMDADDLVDDGSRGEIWRLTDSFYGASFVWAALGNFGGNNGLYGDMALVHNRSARVLAESPTVDGFGIAMEVRRRLFVLMSCIA